MDEIGILRRKGFFREGVCFAMAERETGREGAPPLRVRCSKAGQQRADAGTQKKIPAHRKKELNMKRFAAVFIITLCLAFGGSSYSQPQSIQGQGSADYNLGETLYGSNCQFCHGVNGDGNGPAGASMYPRPADFTDPQFWKNTNKEQMANTILNGRGMMPAFRHFSPGDIEALIDYISHFRKSGKE
jgi:mono/diheme cytochrome c family protein